MSKGGRGGTPPGAKPIACTFKKDESERRVLRDRRRDEVAYFVDAESARDVCDSFISANKKRRVSDGCSFDPDWAFLFPDDCVDSDFAESEGDDDDDESDSAYTAVKSSSTGEEWFPDILANGGRLTIFVAGAPGAGKSYFSKQLIEYLPKDYDVLLFTALEEDDGNFSEIGPRLHKVKMVPDVLRRITLSSIRARSKHTILLFDDIDKIRDQGIKRAVFSLLEDALANGRGHKKHDGEGDLHVITTSHALNDYKQTKYMLENSDYVALFPLYTTRKQMITMFDKLGLTKELCDEVIKDARRGRFRRIIIHKVAPLYLIAGPTIRLL